jgi:hypothetical protein
MILDKFTGWVFIWFILYKLGCISYNPILTLYIITFITVFFTIYLLIKKVNRKIIAIYFITSIFFMKIIPILLLKMEYSSNDIQFSIFLLAIYCIYLFIVKKTNIFDYYITLAKSIENENLWILDLYFKLKG